MSDIIDENGDGLYIVRGDAIVPAHTQEKQVVHELKAYLHEWQLDGIEVNDD